MNFKNNTLDIGQQNQKGQGVSSKAVEKYQISSTSENPQKF